jgi:cytochrome c551/c552
VRSIIVWFVLPGVASAEEPARLFDKRVAPILTKRCLGCHKEELKNGNVSFVDRNSLLKGGSHGPAIVPGRPTDSYLVKTIQHDGDVKMPPGPKMPEKEIRTLAQWISRGAPWGTKLGGGRQ